MIAVFLARFLRSIRPRISISLSVAGVTMRLPGMPRNRRLGAIPTLSDIPMLLEVSK